MNHDMIVHIGIVLWTLAIVMIFFVVLIVLFSKRGGGGRAL